MNRRMQGGPRAGTTAPSETPGGELVNLAERRVASPAFMGLFADGIALIDEAADYLDGIGRADSALLGRRLQTDYARQSRALSTRLMNLTSWLLLQRAVNDGDMSMADALAEGAKVDLGGDAGSPDAEAADPRLPGVLLELIARSFELQRQVRQLDTALRMRIGVSATTVTEPRIGNGVAGQLGRLRSAFERP